MTERSSPGMTTTVNTIGILQDECARSNNGLDKIYILIKTQRKATFNSKRRLNLKLPINTTTIGTGIFAL